MNLTGYISPGPRTEQEWERFLENVRQGCKLTLRQRMDLIWALVKTPTKFPAPQRRRRGDREVPKAA